MLSDVYDVKYKWFLHVKKAYQLGKLLIYLVPGAGIEPARLAALDFESSASTNSATPAAK